MSLGPAIDAGRVIADLRELARRSSDERGAQRLCWSPTWVQARRFLRELLAELGLEPELDAAGNLWARLDGADPSGPALALGSHLDSVPDGGWLDGALGVMAALGVLRAWVEAGETPPAGLALVDWADEEGARFGRSLFGSSAFCGTLDPGELRELRDSDGRPIAEVLAEHGVELERLASRPWDTAPATAERLFAYLELHIEQGPVLEGEGCGVAAVSGCVGVERHRLRFRGQAAHAGTTPMDARRDAGLAAAQLALAVEGIAREHGGVATTGSLSLRPGIPTAVVGEAELIVDLRHGDPGALAAMLGAALDSAGSSAAARGCSLDAETVWRIAPIRFDPNLVESCVAIVRGAGGRADPITSGALHDAAEIAGVMPAAMVFVPSLGGLSHAEEEDTREGDLALGIDSFAKFANVVVRSRNE